MNPQSPIDIKDDLISEKTLNDYGYAIGKYKEKLNKGSTFLIPDINEVNECNINV